jgi:hypothetical protein
LLPEGETEKNDPKGSVEATREGRKNVETKEKPEEKPQAEDKRINKDKCLG